MTRAIQVKRADVVADVRELAAILGVSLTDAIHEAVRVKLLAEQTALMAEREAGQREADEILAKIRSAPRVGRPMTDEDLYDVEGLPK